jgi:probable DNA metabolism protein
MSDGGVLIFAYDGSYEGMMCAVFDAFAMKKMPSDIVIFDDLEPSLLKIHDVKTEHEHALRVETAMVKKLGPGAANIVRRGFLYGEGGREKAIMRFLWKGFNEGRKAVGMLADRDVNPLYKMAMSVCNEERLMQGFLRFSEVNRALVSTIHPKHYLLPLLRGHFCARYRNENFMIFDESHGAALIHSARQTAIIPMERLEKPEPEDRDEFYCSLWKSYYKHIAISSRYNPTCRMTHMPKRFWADMPEVAEELESSYRPVLKKGTAAEITAELSAEKIPVLKSGS